MHEGVLRIVGPCASQDKVLCIAIEFASNSWTSHVNLWHIHRMDWRDAEKKSIISIVLLRKSFNANIIFSFMFASREERQQCRTAAFQNEMKIKIMR